MLLALVIGNYNLEEKLRASEMIVAEQKVALVELETRNKLLDNAKKSAIALAHDEAKIIEKKIIEIKKVYIPQIEYIDRYVGEGNETNCEKNVNGIITGFIY